MKRLTIFEGPDGSGKTTLAYAFTRATQATLIHHGSYLNTPDDLLADVYGMSMDLAVSQMSDVVLDRCWLSEPCYGPVMRNKVRLLKSDVIHLENCARRRTMPLVVLCLPPIEKCFEAFRSRPQEEYLKKETQLTQVYQSYLDMTTTLPVVRYDRTTHGTDLAAFVQTLVDWRKP